MSVIYAIKNLSNGKVYVGKSIEYKKRKWKHKSYLRSNTHGNAHLQRAFNKYGEESFEFVILERFDPRTNFDINAMERYWIKQLDANNPDKGYNLTSGGDGCVGYRLSDEQKKKISETHKGKRLSEETRRRMSESLKGRKGPLLGKVFTQEHRRKMSETRLTMYKRGDNPRARIVLDTETGHEYACIKDAAEAFGYQYRTLVNWLNGKTHNKSTLIFKEYLCLNAS